MQVKARHVELQTGAWVLREGDISREDHTILFRFYGAHHFLSPVGDLITIMIVLSYQLVTTIENEKN